MPIPRKRHVDELEKLLRQFPVVAILGARQIGKTTLAHQLIAQRRGKVSFFDLERAADQAALQNPQLALEGMRGLVVIDEVQRQPGLFEALRVLADRPRKPARFLLLGSASPELLTQSETLAGRIAYHELGGLDVGEIKATHLSRLWIRGGFPRSFLARSHAESATWRREFISAFLERDLPQLGVTISATTLRRFWTMLAHYHGKVWNASAFASSFGVADTTVRRYLDLLTSALVVQQLPPWHENIRKRQVKSPKVYLRDSGILHTLLDLETQRQVESHPMLGASWEGFLINEIRRVLRARPDQCYFWATFAGAELDLLVVRGNKRVGFEIKRTDMPGITRSMRQARSDLKLDRLYLVHAGSETFPMDHDIQAVAWTRLLRDLK
jgi:predicted AAA+ superfamily ATPase